MMQFWKTCYLANPFVFELFLFFAAFSVEYVSVSQFNGLYYCYLVSEI